MAGNSYPGYGGAGNTEPPPGTFPFWRNVGAGRAGTIAEAIKQTIDQF